MHRRTGGLVVFLILAFALPGAGALAQEPAAPASTPAAAPAGPVVGSMKIVCSGKAKNDGVLNLVFTPAGGEAKEVRVTLQKGMKPGEVCRDVSKELSVALSGAPYKVEHYDDDKVKVEGAKEAKFSLSLGGQTVTGLTIQMK